MKKKKLFLNVIWYVYLATLFVVVIVKFRGSFFDLYYRAVSAPFDSNYNLIPFRSIGVQLKHIREGWAQLNLLGNIIPFVPFGFLLPIVHKKTDTIGGVLIYGFVFILLAEAFQFVSRLGSFDIDDIILNMLSVLIGFTVRKIFSRLSHFA